jgi:hypothetical protein
MPDTYSMWYADLARTLRRTIDSRYEFRTETQKLMMGRVPCHEPVYRLYRRGERQPLLTLWIDCILSDLRERRLPILVDATRSRQGLPRIAYRGAERQVELSTELMPNGLPTDPANTLALWIQWIDERRYAVRLETVTFRADGRTYEQPAMRIYARRRRRPLVTFWLEGPTYAVHELPALLQAECAEVLHTA